MSDWLERLRHVEPLEDVALDAGLVGAMESEFAELEMSSVPGINFYTPTFKVFQTSELKDCGKSAWPAVSITGGDCKLQCDHCKAKILDPMLPARTPEDLWRVVNGIIEEGAQGC